MLLAHKERKRVEQMSPQDLQALKKTHARKLAVQKRKFEEEIAGTVQDANNVCDDLKAKRLKEREAMKTTIRTLVAQKRKHEEEIVSYKNTVEEADYLFDELEKSREEANNLTVICSALSKKQKETNEELEQVKINNAKKDEQIVKLLNIISSSSCITKIVLDCKQK